MRVSTAVLSIKCDAYHGAIIAAKFHELNQAYELLLDPLRRMALDARLRTAAAKKARFQQYDNKRKRMIEELEEREAAFKRAKTAQREQAQEEERVKDEGRRMMAERAKRAQEEEEEREEGDDGEGEDTVGVGCREGEVRNDGVEELVVRVTPDRWHFRFRRRRM